MEISGRVNPHAPELDVDIDVSARVIELLPLSPCSARHAGCGIDKGKLSMDVKCFIGNRKLGAENRVVFDRATSPRRSNGRSA